ncbi:flavin-containing monooxygenase [Enterovirga sp. CN4-39]|uniref:flavin-containing monooxygenase n=1 Tax=Enterovirga sp. CN4-39 TaxID=3400910 RepID=UPI003C00EB8E
MQTATRDGPQPWNEQALETADPFLVLTVLAYLTGEQDWLAQADGAASKPGRGPGDVPETLRRSAIARLGSILASGDVAPKADVTLLPRIVRFCVGEPVPDEYMPMLLEEAGLAPRPLDQLPPLRASYSAEGRPEVAIVGAGLSGVALAVHLKRLGIPFVIYEKNEGVGGTWYDNRYPGCGVDTTSHFYTYSFALNPNWSRYFTKQPDMLAYIDNCVDRFGIRDHIRFGHTLAGASYDETRGRWRLSLRTADGETAGEAAVLVSAIGQLNVPSTPGIPGLDTFAGPVMHTSRWDPDFDHRGKRVALLGSGASAVQVGPSMAPEVERLIVFQRSPQWLSIRPNYHLPVPADELWLLGNIPSYVNWHRLRIIWQFSDRLYPALLRGDTGAESGRNSVATELRQQWSDHIRRKLRSRPDLLAKALPDYAPLTKRVPVDFGWFDMLLRENVELVTEPIARVERGAIVTEDGASHAVDAIVLATGFQATRILEAIDVTGRSGVSLRERWGEDDPRAYLGMTVPGFPNFFVMYGPNTNLGHGGSLILQGECQARYIATAIRHMAETGCRELDCREDVFARYNDDADGQLARMVWSDPKVGNWFKNRAGRIVTNSPWRVLDYWQMTRDFDPADYEWSADRARGAS